MGKVFTFEWFRKKDQRRKGVNGPLGKKYSQRVWGGGGGGVGGIVGWGGWGVCGWCVGCLGLVGCLGGAYCWCRGMV